MNIVNGCGYKTNPYVYRYDLLHVYVSLLTSGSADDHRIEFGYYVHFSVWTELVCTVAICHTLSLSLLGRGCKEHFKLVIIPAVLE